MASAKAKAAIASAKNSKKSYKEPGPGTGTGNALTNMVSNMVIQEKSNGKKKLFENPEIGIAGAGTLGKMGGMAGGSVDFNLPMNITNSARLGVGFNATGGMGFDQMGQGMGGEITPTVTLSKTIGGKKKKKP